MKALTVRQPWAELIVSGCKDVENRSRRTFHRGPLAIHAGLEVAVDVPTLQGPVDRGAIIGLVDVIDCVDNSPSRWALAEHWHWVLGNAQRLTPPIPYRGALGIWSLDPATERLVRRRLSKGVRSPRPPTAIGTMRPCT
jgi:ASCH domain-containing protein